MIQHRSRPMSPRLVAALVVVFTVLIASDARSQPTFADATAEAGLLWPQWDGVVPSDLPPGDREVWMMSGAAAAGDFNGDGWIDLFFTRINAPNLLFRNRGDGTFQQAGHAAGIDLVTSSTGCAVGDVDGDGDVDIYVMTGAPDNRNYLYLNDGTGRFTEDAAARGVTMYVPGGTHRCTSCSFGDYDNDGDLDLITSAWQVFGNKNLLFRNDGTGHFDEVTAAAGLSTDDCYGFTPRLADVTNDGWPDYLLVADYGTSCLFRNMRDGTFRDIRTLAQTGTEENGMGSALGDIDNDGDLDWFVTSIYDTRVNHHHSILWGRSGNRLYRNTGTGLFVDSTDACGVRNGDWGWGASFFDYDNDGDLDLGMTNGMNFPWVPWEERFHTDSMRMWSNNGTGAMTDVSAASGLNDDRTGKGFLTLDYDRDGDLDVLVTNNASTPILYRNDGGNASAWLQVELSGSTSNRQGIGARVYVQATKGGPEQMRELSAGSNFMSQDEAIAHFGFGPGVTALARVRVVWPASGTESLLTDVATNQRITVSE